MRHDGKLGTVSDAHDGYVHFFGFVLLFILRHHMLVGHASCQSALYVRVCVSVFGL